MALKLPDSAVPMGDFPVAKAVDIDFDDGENLQEKLDNGKLGGGGNTTDLTDLENASIMYCDVAEINKAKGTNISLVAGEDNTEKIMNVLAPHEVFAGWFMNEPIYNRFGIDLSMGDRLNFVSIQKYHNNDGVVIAITNKGKVLSRYMRNNILSNWDYDTTDLTDIENRLDTLEENELDVDVTTTINSFSTNTQIPTARAVSYMHHGIILDNGVDVLKLKVGAYNLPSYKVVSTCTNLPSTHPGKLIIRSLHGDQERTPYNASYTFFVYEYRDMAGDIYICSVNNNTPNTSPDNVDVRGWFKVAKSEDLTDINTKLTQLENKANFIPVVADNPTDYDLNNYKENGNYSIGDSSKYSNVPIAQPALLTVIRSNSYRLQIYTVVNNDDVYFRKSTNGGNSWSSWSLLNGEVDLTPINTKLTQLENTINQVGGGGIYSSGEIEVGKWVDGQTLYRSTISDSTERTFSSGIMMLDFFTLSRDEYVVVKLDGTFRMCAATDNSGAHTVYALPYVDLDTNRQVHLVYTTQDRVRLSGRNLKDYKILGYDVSIYYYKK